MRKIFFIQEKEPKTDFLTDRDYCFWFKQNGKEYKCYYLIDGEWKFKYHGLIKNLQEIEINPLVEMGHIDMSEKDITDFYKGE